MRFFFAHVSFSSTYYWVGGSGNWSEIGHWATSSGGTTFYPIIPGPSDDIVFDANSFTASNHTLTVDPAFVSVKSINWIGVTNSPSFISTGTLNIANNLVFSASTLTSFKAFTINVGGDVTLLSSTVQDFLFSKSNLTQTVSIDGNLDFGNSVYSIINQSNGQRSSLTVGKNISFGNSSGTLFAGKLVVLGNVSAGNSILNLGVGDLFAYGSFAISTATSLSRNLNKAQGWNFIGTATGLSLDLKGVALPTQQIVTINNPTGSYSLLSNYLAVNPGTGLNPNSERTQIFGNFNSNGFQISVSNLQIGGNGGTGNVSLGSSFISATAGVTFNQTELTTVSGALSSINAPSIRINGSSGLQLGRLLNATNITNNTNTIVSFKSAYFSNVGNITGNNVFDSLVVTARGLTLSLGANQTQQINKYLYYRATGCFPSFLKSTVNGQQANIKLASNVSFASEFLTIQDINVVSTGAGFYIGQSSVNGGNNTNVLFNSAKANVWGGLDPDIRTCNTPPITLTSNQFGSYQNIVWSTGATTSSINVTTSGNYHVNVQFGSGCGYRDTLNVQFLTNPVLAISGASNVSANQTGVAYSTTSLSGYDYQWSTPAGASLVGGQGLRTTTVDFNGFIGGNISVTGTNLATNCSARTQYFVSVPTTAAGTPRYGIQPRTIFCGAGTSFCVPISTNVPISPYVVGLDFELFYDPNFIIPTGLATLGPVATSYGNYSLNTAIPGKVIASIYLDNSPINTYMNGSGDVICIGFTVRNTVQPGQTLSVFSSSPILESGYLDASTVPSILPGAYTFSRPLNLSLNYQGTNTRLTGATGQNTTKIQGFDFTTTSTVGSTLPLNAQGIFQVLDLGTGNVKIGRDVAGDVSVPSASCANVLPVINSTDRLLATQISNGIVATPSIYQLLAADVNLDGKVSAGDATLISMRAVNAFNCEFPQLWNYQLDASGNLVPKPTCAKSIDWVFLDRAVLTTPGFVGATKSNVPSLAPFIALNTNRNTPCNGLIDQTIAGILLGDVNANWTTTNGATLRTEEIQNTVVINLDSIRYLADGTIEIPFTYESNDSLTGIDFSLNYDTLTLGIKSIGVASDLNSTYGIVYNNIKSIGRLMVSSYIKQNPIVVNNSVLVLKLNKYVGPLVASSFTNISAYFNGVPANVRVDGGAAITSYQEELFKNLRLHPNPTTGIVLVNFASSNATYELSTVLGSPIQSGSLNSEINLSDVHAGVYTLSITLDGVKKNFKIIKQ